jgi:hypothetical protein
VEFAISVEKAKSIIFNMLIKKYTDRIDFNLLLTSSGGKGGVCRLSEDIKGQLIEGVYQVTFRSLYAHLFVAFYREGFFKTINIDSKLVDKVEYFIRYQGILKKQNNLLNDPIMRQCGFKTYDEYRTWINSLYIKELRSYTYSLMDIYSQYMNMYFDDTVEMNKFNWLYIDTDVFYLLDNTGGTLLSNIPDIGVMDYDDIDLDYFELAIFDDKKRYIKYNGLEVSEYGIRINPETKDMMSKGVRTIVRERKLNIILDDKQIKSTN